MKRYYLLSPSKYNFYYSQISELESILKTPKASATKSLEDLIMDRLPNQLPVHDLQVMLMIVIL